MDNQEIAKRARKSISSYCFDECHAFCCRKGHLIVTQEELDKITGNDVDAYKPRIKKLEDGKYSLYNGGSDQACPSLDKDLKCKIHTDKLRPLVCKEFPLFIKEGFVILSQRCPAVAEGKFYPFIKQLQLNGLKICYCDDTKGLDVFNNLV